MERYQGGIRVEEAADPVGAISVGKEGGARVFTHYEGRMRGSQESTSRGEGGGERRGGGPGPALEYTFRLSFLWRLARRVSFLSFVFPLSLSFLVRGGHYDRLGRSARMLVG